MKQFQTQLIIQTRGKSLTDFTTQIQSWVADQPISTGLLTLFISHTSASLTIQENADPDVQVDLNNFMERIAPNNPAMYTHTAEGPDDMPAHIRTALTDVQLSIPVSEGQLTLGTWQGVYVFEHRSRAHARKVILHLMGN